MGDAHDHLPRILIVEDDARLAKLVREYLADSGFEVQIEGRGDEAVERIPAWSPDVVILDLMRNLLENAARYATGGVTLRLARSGSMAVVEVCDDGPGVPPADRDRIFEAFSRLDGSRGRDGGVGLGLAIVRRILEAHGGTVTVDDAPEGGARFTTTGPLQLYAPIHTHTRRYRRSPEDD